MKRILKGYEWTNIEQHNSVGDWSIKFYYNKTERKFIIAQCDKGEPVAVSDPMDTGIVEALYFGLEDFKSRV